MPHVSIKVYSGKTEQQKIHLAEEIVKDVMTHFQVAEKSVTVAIEDVPPEDWADQVYNPEIVGKESTLYKKPGYTPPGALLAGIREGNVEIRKSGSQPSGKGPSDWFTGTVRVDPLFQPHTPARTTGAAVTFEPGARTAWHTHPLGQTLIVTAGRGFVQCWGRPVEEIRAGDVVWFPPGVKHWHGAASTTAMTHIAIQESLGGKNVEWLEKVTDEQYDKRKNN